MRLFAHEAFLLIIRDEYPRDHIPKQEAFENLRVFSGHDFGEDVAAWTDWSESLTQEELNKCYLRFEKWKKEQIQLELKRRGLI